MYRTCLFCSRDLGSNEAIEHFPVGRRLAFDPEKGRLWVICPSCTRWNLTPLEERWEAIEEAERLFRATTLRASTEHIGLARIAEGTDFVRIGRPQRPEIAAWRYGTQFARRRNRRLIWAGLAATGGAALLAGGLSAGLGVVTVFQLGKVGLQWGERGYPLTTVARIRDEHGSTVDVKRRDLLRSTIGVGRDGQFAVTVDGHDRFVRFEGEHARRAAAALFPAVNRAGGSADDVQSAIGRLERAGSAEAFLRDVSRRGSKLTRVVHEHEQKRYEASAGVQWESGLLALSTTLGLAIEMALHEEQERRALEGELAQLEAAWKDAEEIGAISDSLLLPRSIESAIARLRGN